VKQISFDFNNMFASNIGRKHGVTDQDLRVMSKSVSKAGHHLKSILSSSGNRIKLGLEWAMLPYQDRESTASIQEMGEDIAKQYDNVISLGIGGSYLGLKAAQDALASPYYNDFEPVRGGRPRIYFEGNNLDPDTLSVLLKNLDARRTFVIVISKSGETTETKAAFAVVENWLKNTCGPLYGRQIFAITDPKSGQLRSKVNAEQAKDGKSFRNLPVLSGVGGRFSELNIGLLHLAIIGVDIQEVLDGAKAMAKRCSQDNLFKNPAYMYAVLHTILYKKKGKPISIMMPFSETLKSTADWYSQLLAESLGKKYQRTVKPADSGTEEWIRNKKKAANLGRTPVSSRGTNDLHSIQQNNIEGENDKAITFLKIEKFVTDIEVSGTNDFLSGKYYSKLLATAEEATEWALVRESRPNCTMIIPKLTAYHWGEIIFFFEMATAFEGELLNVNAYDQPGVEGYKNYMYFKLRKPGISPVVSADIKKNPLIKAKKFII